MTQHPQRRASDPGLSAFVAANAGSGKTKTLVERVARLLLHGAQPGAILCVTYTKAAAAEMQRRLYQQLGDWSVMQDEALKARLDDLGEAPADLATARRLFARALETPGGLKIQTLHAFCEKLLRRFPLEAGVTPGFRVMDDAASAEISLLAREALARRAALQPPGLIAQAYAHFVVDLDIGAFEALLKTFETERSALEAHLAAAGGLEGAALGALRCCGFQTAEEASREAIEARALAGCDFTAWRAAADALSASGKATDRSLALALAAAAAAGGPDFPSVWRIFSTQDGTPLARLGTGQVPQAVRDGLRAEQARLNGAAERVKAAKVAQETVYALALADAYARLYQDEKARRGALDFADLIVRTRRLLTQRADAAWVLYKLDGGIDHVLLDEAQDTSPDQWEILEALTGEFFAGEGGRGSRLNRTLFAVGDEKQSIYSFQGADPDQLRQQTAAYEVRAAAVPGAFAVVPLLESWRSTPEVLAFVDAVFADPAASAAVSPALRGEAIAHYPVRPPGLGAVDLWSLHREEPRAAVGAWDAPLDAPAPESARKRLARRIAQEAVSLVNRAAVADRGDPRKPPTLRPATAGDILILVRQRDALFEEMIRALKKAGLPVAGADRLALSDHGAFQDILSLVRAVLFPDDDLSVAEVLRSPFCDLSEQDLYDLAVPRTGSLWSALMRREGERTAFAEAARLLHWAADAARSRPPFDFLSLLLTRADGEGRSMRRRIVTRLGREAEDALDEVLSQALACEARGVRDLERFACALERSNLSVKRELDGEDGGEVRVMTVHGAKGLEAPIVFLPDTTGKPKSSNGGLLKTADGVYLFAPRKAEDCDASKEARARHARRALDEQTRLLYVALTRSRDRLILAGRLTAKQTAAPEGSWRRLVETAFQRAEIADFARPIEGGEVEILRFGADPATASATPTAAPASEPPAPLWIAKTPPPEDGGDVVRPSAILGSGAAPSPLAVRGGLGRFRRGVLIHRLLEILPDLPEAERRSAADRILARERDLDPHERAEMAQAARAVLSDARFAEVFGQGSRAEAGLAGTAPDLPPGMRVSARVDRMVVTPARVLVVDFKTNRPAPRTIEETDRAYVAQLAIYVALARAVFPGRRVEAALVWTDGPELMPVPDLMIEAALEELRQGH